MLLLLQMFLLLDECCGRYLARLAADLGHSAQRTIEVAALGRQASDHAIFDFARSAGAIVVTVNRNDFVALAARGREHPGMILLPSLTNAELRLLFPSALVAAEPLFAQAASMIVEIKADGSISSYRLPF